jgi:hypothetical protein
MKKEGGLLNPETRVLICRLTEKIKQDETFAQQLNIRDCSHYREQKRQCHIAQGEKKYTVMRGSD